MTGAKVQNSVTFVYFHDNCSFFKVEADRCTTLFFGFSVQNSVAFVDYLDNCCFFKVEAQHKTCMYVSKLVLG